MSKSPLQAAGEIMAELSGSCPLDRYGWCHPMGCEKVCKVGQEPKCWSLYAKDKSKEEDNE
jgi:hypothetical protein